ncbi:MAG: M14 family zinc carboxypeptidase [Candidatus Zixiibacteriota bacterium]
MLLKKIIFILPLLLISLFGNTNADDTTYIQARIQIDSRENLDSLMGLALDIVNRGDYFIEIVTYDKQIDEIEALGFKTEIVLDDITAFLQSRLPKDKDMGGYKTLAEINSYLDGIIADHPTLVSQKISIGQTIEGRDMWAVKISDNPGLDEDEPEILFGAAIHCREVITPEVLFYFMDYLTNNYKTDPEAAFLVDNREMWFIPLINPDGYYYNELTDPDGGGMWRKNRRNNGDGTYGVDLNRNFGYEWGYDDEGSSPYPSDPTYRGSAPFSEPETQNVRDFIISHNFVMTINYHSYGNYALYPWSYDEYYAVDHDIYSVLGDSAASFNGYTPGTAWEVLYTVNGGSDDWGYGEQTLKDKCFALTLEVGSYEDNFWPAVERIPELVSENLQPNLFFANIVGNVYIVLPPLIPVPYVPDTVFSGGYNISWHIEDTLNPPIQFELVEMQNKLTGLVDSAADLEDWMTNGFTVSGARYYSPSTSFYSGSGNSLNRYLQTAEMITVAENDTLKFRTYYDIEDDWDYAYVEISTDGVSFSPIEGNISANNNPHGYNLGNGITGSSGGWVPGLFSLADFAGQQVYIRFTYRTDEYVAEEGFYIDDISPLVGFENIILISSEISDTLYTFSDKPVGEYYYKVRAKDAEDQWSQFSDPVMTYVVESPYFCGDANGDGTVNLLDITFLISFLYKSGPSPDPFESADVNSSGSVNILDITYILSYLYKNGPAPDCPI